MPFFSFFSNKKKKFNEPAKPLSDDADGDDGTNDESNAVVRGDVQYSRCHS